MPMPLTDVGSAVSSAAAAAAIRQPSPGGRGSSAGFSPELHALRGLAALVVVVRHTTHVVDTGGPAEVWLGTLFNSGGAVAFFFVLSGFVLALSLRGRATGLVPYGRYVVRRGFRLMPLLVFTAVLGTLYCNLLDPHRTYPFSTEWFNRFYAQDIGPWHFVGALVGASARANPPTWSIYVEIIASLLIPFMVLAAGRATHALVAGAALFALALLPLGLKYAWHVFLINFFVGVSITLWGPALVRGMARWAPSAGAGALHPLLVGALAAVFLLFRGLVGPVEHGDWLVNAVEVAAVAPIIALVYYRPAPFRVLNGPVFRFLGDISYSLYLVHFIVMAATYHFIVLNVPVLAADLHVLLAAMVAAVLAVSTAVSYLTFRYVERPGIALGRRLLAPDRRPAPATAGALGG